MKSAPSPSLGAAAFGQAAIPSGHPLSTWWKSAPAAAPSPGLIPAACCGLGLRARGLIPGTACYGQGGTEPTVTDANLVLGRLNPGYLLGGDLQLDSALAHEAIEERIARPLGLDVCESRPTALWKSPTWP